uniref:Uncharacterized protein n=1 Tax=Quercus lobata TaxID=97700 RepID=A0A7N2LJG7_QUELO
MESGEKELGICDYTGRLRLWGWVNQAIKGFLDRRGGNKISNFDSSGVSGELPSTFAKLQNLQIVWASDTNLTGRIPDFIGTWSNLVSL